MSTFEVLTFVVGQTDHGPRDRRHLRVDIQTGTLGVNAQPLGYSLFWLRLVRLGVATLRPEGQMWCGCVSQSGRARICKRRPLRSRSNTSPVGHTACHFSFGSRRHRMGGSVPARCTLPLKTIRTGDAYLILSLIYYGIPES